MTNKKVVGTVYGKYSKYEIVENDGGLVGGTSFYIYKDGKPHRGTFSSLRSAMEAAENEK